MSNQDNIFDYASLAALLQNDDALINTILESFLGDFVEQMMLLNQAISDGDVVAAQKLSHKIKGATANIRAIEINQITTAMDAAGKAGQLEGISCRMDELDAAYQRFKACVETMSAN